MSYFSYTDYEAFHGEPYEVPDKKKDYIVSKKGTVEKYYVLQHRTLVSLHSLMDRTERFEESEENFYKNYEEIFF